MESVLKRNSFILLSIPDIIKKKLCYARKGELCTMKYEGIILHSLRFISLTSLKPEELVFLLKHYTPFCNSYFRYHTTMGLKRKIITSSEHKNSKLLGCEQKLFFLSNKLFVSNICFYPKNFTK